MHSGRDIGVTNRGIHWMSWEKLSVHNFFSGMWFKDLTSFNLAMLSKQACKLQSNVRSLGSRLFKASYFPTSYFVGAKIGTRPRYIWQSILSVSDMV
jgi:hypothetical protein